MAGGSPGLTLDRYHIDSAFVSWRTGRNGVSTFDLYARRAPFGGAFMLVAGLEQAVEFVCAFCFSADDVDFIRDMGNYPDGFLEELRRTEFTGEIFAMAEGTVAFPDEPILRVTAPLREALLLEAGLLHAISFPTLVATKAARVVHAAAGRPVAEFSLRRSAEPFMVARAAAIAGCSSTSFLGAAATFGLTASGTIPHALVQAFPSEAEAFRAVAESLARYTLLLDTYNVRRAIQTAVEVARETDPRTGNQLSAVRLDSGDVADDARFVRKWLDQNGFTDVKILASGDLDEFSIDELVRADAPVDAFGVGTSIGTATGFPERGISGGHLNSVYKLVWSEEPGVPPPVKEAAEKGTWPGRKHVWRAGKFNEDVIGLEDERPPPDATPLLEPVVRDGEPVRPMPGLHDARERARMSLSGLPDRYRALTGAPAYPIRRTKALETLREQALRPHL